LTPQTVKYTRFTFRPVTQTHQYFQILGRWGGGTALVPRFDSKTPDHLDSGRDEKLAMSPAPRLPAARPYSPLPVAVLASGHYQELVVAFTGIGGRFAPEWMVDFVRHRWSESIGIGGRFGPECAQ